jgi:hypothetical protein
VASERIEGKRTFIEHHGNVFELPAPHHTIELEDLSDGTTMAMLNTPMEGSSFQLAAIEELDDRVIVHLGSEFGRHGPPGMGDNIPELHGYPFPSV